MGEEMEYGQELEALEAAVDELEVMAAAPPDFAAVCEIYCKVKRVLEPVLPWIEKALPKYGKVIAQAIRILMMLLDFLCKMLGKPCEE